MRGWETVLKMVFKSRKAPFDVGRALFLCASTFGYDQGMYNQLAASFTLLGTLALLGYAKGASSAYKVEGSTVDIVCVRCRGRCPHTTRYYRNYAPLFSALKPIFLCDKCFLDENYLISSQKRDII